MGHEAGQKPRISDVGARRSQRSLAHCMLIDPPNAVQGCPTVSTGGLTGREYLVHGAPHHGPPTSELHEDRTCGSPRRLAYIGTNSRKAEGASPSPFLPLELPSFLLLCTASTAHGTVCPRLTMSVRCSRLRPTRGKRIGARCLVLETTSVCHSAPFSISRSATSRTQN
jgi:hypothetical protein